jgi:hypothetical protein
MHELIRRLTLAALVVSIVVVLGVVWARTHPGWLDSISSSGPTIVHYDSFAVFAARGTVLDESSGAPIPGADLFFTLSSYTDMSPAPSTGRLVGSSGADGVVAFEFPYAWGGEYEMGKAAPPESFRLTIRAEGHRDFVHEFQNLPDQGMDGSPIQLEFGIAFLSP